MKIKFRIYRSRLDAITLFPKTLEEIFDIIEELNLKIESDFFVGFRNFIYFKNSKNYVEIETF